ncbi:MAG: macro domain-containing protein [Candidatus Woesearchaeota archaeon]
MKVIYQTGYAIDKDVDAVVNSANGFLMLGTSGAGRIRELSKPLNTAEKKEYSMIFKRLPKKVQNFYSHLYGKYGWKLTRDQLSCVKTMVQRKGHAVKRGTAVLDRNRVGKKNIIHAVAMSYHLYADSWTRTRATTQTIKNAVRSAMKIADLMGAKSVAIPVMAARKTYGVTPDQSLHALLSVLREFEDSSIKKVMICFDNERTEEYLKKIKK